MENNQTKCPNLCEIDLLVVNKSLSQDTARLLKSHIEICPSCRQRYEELKFISNEFNKEFLKPVYPKVYQLIKQIENDAVDLSCFVLQPMEDSQDRESAGENTFVLKKVDHPGDSADDLYGSGNIIIHALQKKSSRQTCLAIWAADIKFYKNVELCFCKTNQFFLSNEIGLIEANTIDVNVIDNQVVRFLNI